MAVGDPSPWPACSMPAGPIPAGPIPPGNPNLQPAVWPARIGNEESHLRRYWKYYAAGGATVLVLPSIIGLVVVISALRQSKSAPDPAVTPQPAVVIPDQIADPQWTPEPTPPNIQNSEESSVPIVDQRDEQPHPRPTPKPPRKKTPAKSTGRHTLHLVMGAAYGKLNRPSEAISEFSSATRVDPDAVEAHRSLAEAYLENKDNVNAKKTALRAIRLDEGDYRSHIALGDANFNLRYYQDAINAYRRAVQIQSNAAKAHLMMGRSYFMLGQDREAVTAYHQALRFKTDYPVDANYFMSLAHVRLRDFDAALEDLREALRLDPKYAYAHLQMGSLYQQQGRYEDAIANTQKFVDLRPADGDGYIVLSWYYSFLRRHEAAAQAGLKAVQYAPEQHMGYTNLCRALYDLGEYRNAMQRCQRAIELNPRDGETLFYLGRVHEALKNPAEAKRAFAGALTGMLEFVRQNPKDADGRYLLGNIYMANEQPRSAIEAYRMAISLQPRFPFAISNLGIAYLWVKDRQSALAQYRELQSIDLVEAEKLLKKIEPRRTGRR